MVVAAACLLAGILLRRVIVREVILPLAAGEAGRYLGLDVQADDLTLDVRGSVTISGLAASGPGHRTAIESLSIERASASFSPWKLLAGDAGWLEAVRVEGLRVKLDLAKEPLFPGEGGDGEKPQDGPGEDRLEALLPDVELRGARIALTDGWEDLLLEGVDATLRAGRLALRIARTSGTWSVPRIEAVPGPVQLDARLAAGAGGTEEIILESLRLGGKEMARDVKLVPGPGGGLAASGDLPGWGLEAVRVTLEGGVLDATLRTEKASVGEILDLDITPG